MRRLAVIAALLALALPAHAQPGATSDAELAEALHGCWFRKSWSAEIEAQRADPDFRISSQMCFAGGLEGEVDDSFCQGYSSDDCGVLLASYALRDGKLWRDYGPDAADGRLSVCDVTLDGNRWLTLSNCQWVEGDAGPIEDIAYERIVDL
ncbi:hypothetical protein VE25_20545 [Devosia geojensis]|uniref:DUF2147 domain-containing protein n=1 Tax=Devosia geojensis TaxID=443610 RepID=A0A0F5FDD6_9HYPH|nr:hypothetical protein [Devosia geojensis]KKB06866.1 hypothetical protein VE25_20545 [Devosia geojensis]